MNRVRARWAKGEPAVAAWMQGIGALAADALARCGYDAVVIDLQHSPTSIADAMPMLAAIEAGGAEPFVRTSWNDPPEIMKLLDNGAYGIIAPMVNDASEAAQLAQAVHYPPRGLRSWGPRRPLHRYSTDYAARASEATVAMAMIETRAALASLDQILAENIDGLFIGPADLAFAITGHPDPESQDSEVTEAHALILDRAHRAGKKAGIFCASSAFASARIAQGFDLVTTPPDFALMTGAAKASIAEIRPR